MLAIPEGGEPAMIEREPAVKTRGEEERANMNGEVNNNKQGRELKRHISK